MARPPRWQATLDAIVEEACLAVRLYNDPAESRSFEGFVVHMHLAWLYLLHAEFIRDDIDYRYWDPKYKRRLLASIFHGWLLGGGSAAVSSN